MRHSITLDGHGYRLRPINDKDASFILKLRNDPVLGRFLNATDFSLQSQLNWLENYYDRAGDWYFIVERRSDNGPEGLISIYDLNENQLKAEWGRWILRSGSNAAIESVWLIYKCAFELLNLHQLYCRTVADNVSVVSFHDSCGIRNRVRLTGHFNINGHVLDAFEHCVDITGWERLGSRLEYLSEKLARRLQNET